MDYTARLNELIETIATDLGYEVVEHTLFQAGHRKILRIFLDKEGGVVVQDCAKFSRELGAALDLEDVLPFAYVLEVSSPGLDRPLKTARDFLRQKGRFVKIQLVDPDPVLGRKVIGEVLSADDAGVLLSINGAEHTLVYGQMLSAKVELQF